MVQALCDLGLVGDGPCRGELGWCQLAVSGGWSVRVVVDAPVLDQYSGFEEAVEPPQVQQFVAEPTVERLDPRVLPRRAGVDEHGVDGVEPAPVRDRTGDNSGPLSNLTTPGTPRCATSLSRTATTPSASIPRSTRIAGHSRVYSSMTFNNFNCPAIRGGVELEIQGRHDIRSDRAERTDLHTDARHPASYADASVPSALPHATGA